MCVRRITRSELFEMYAVLQLNCYRNGIEKCFTQCRRLDSAGNEGKGKGGSAAPRTVFRVVRYK